MRRRELAGSEEWIAEEALAQLSASDRSRVELLAPPRLHDKYLELFQLPQYEAFARPISTAYIAQTSRTIRAFLLPSRRIYHYYQGHGSRPKPSLTGIEALQANIDALQERADELREQANKLREQADELREQADELREQIAELEREPSPAKGHGEPKTALGWILSHPELRTHYAGQHVAFTNTSPFRVVAASSNLDALLDSLGDSLSGIYIHQFA